MATKQASRTDRWNKAISDCREDLEKAQQAKHEVSEKIATLIEELNETLYPINDSLQVLLDLQAEYEEWYDNMPQQLQEGPTGEKLQEIVNQFDFDVQVDEVEEPDLDLDLDGIESLLDEAEGADLPRGFGRD